MTTLESPPSKQTEQDDPRKAEQALFERLEAVYNSLPKVACQGKCQEACGPIGFSQIEAANITMRGFPLPTITTHPIQGPITCSSLGNDGLCTMYEVRPLVCRIFGVARTLACPWGCKPDRWFGPVEKQRVFEELKALSFEFNGKTEPVYTMPPTDLLSAILAASGRKPK